jgi:hypothetical protein
MIETTRIGSPRPKRPAADGPTNEDIMRWRWKAMGIEFTDAKLQAAARDMDEYDARLAREKAEAELPEDDIDDAWDQHDEDVQEQSAPDYDRESDVASGSVDDIPCELGEEFAMDSEPDEPTLNSPPEPEGLLPEKDPAEEIAEAVQKAKATALQETSNPTHLTDECPLYIINRQLANCRVITSTERCCIGLLNSLMQKHGYAYVSNEQLAWWLDMKSSNSVRNMLAKLTKMRLIQNTGRRNLEIRWVVCPELQNPKRDRS